MFASEISEERREELFTKIAQKIVDMRLTPVAVVILESGKPISFVGSQLMVFLQPIFMAVFPFHQYDEIAALMEERPNVELLIEKIEQLEDERTHGKGKNHKNPGN
ncbi:hypothetical protein CH330_08645 [candidate division WOR-3 bacterium JGI_Cruoil_03_51_56]|uniref:Uncharacterized protein n=1 Tax=candidate division WOR-3 bacterium JGI_Cruoil_03_51_56 TaxID=1973747 RepID=A0A235BQ69_UNCW3|nr:MAG: hypothetical protein CH330_08645 [candidate division WOR-3 bacterium JGI_Cruoil_03_51_56]